MKGEIRKNIMISYIISKLFDEQTNKSDLISYLKGICILNGSTIYG
jgi:hypothetical protein